MSQKCGGNFLEISFQAKFSSKSQEKSEILSIFVCVTFAQCCILSAFSACYTGCALPYTKDAVIFVFFLMLDKF